MTAEQTVATHYDSTSNANNGTQHGNDDATGQIASGQILDGNTGAPDWVNVPHDNSIDMGAGQNFTVSGWGKSRQAAAPGVYPVIAAKEYDGVGSRYGYSLILHAATADPRWYFDTYSNDVRDNVYGTSDVANGNWHYLVGVRSGSNLPTYEDGNYANTVAASSGSYSKNVPFRVGTSGEASPGSWSVFGGTVDEVRITGVARDACWMDQAALHRAQAASRRVRLKRLLRRLLFYNRCSLILAHMPAVILQCQFYPFEAWHS